jgi:phosphate transport system substrate-binding protein
MQRTTIPLLTATGLVALAFAGCTSSLVPIVIDGSSTVFLVEQAWAEEFGRAVGAQVTVAFSGTGAGFQKFCRGETDVAGASRPIKDSEAAQCAANGITPYEIQVGIDGLAVVVHPSNDFVDHLTVTELNKIWTADMSKQANRWNEVRSEWPDQDIDLFGAGTDSGTYDYFIETMIHPFDGSSGDGSGGRSDYTPSENDHVLVQGVAGTEYALGYFGLAYARASSSQVKTVPILEDTKDGGQTFVTGAQPVFPTDANVGSGTYSPLSRPLFMYTDGKPTGALQEWFQLGLSPEGQELVAEVGYVTLSESLRTANVAKVS